VIHLAIKIDKKERESFESMLKRFNREVIRSGVINTARQIRFHEKEPNKTALRKSAIRKAKIRAERKKLYFKKG
jgi:ribosomal protein S21